MSYTTDDISSRYKVIDRLLEDTEHRNYELYKFANTFYFIYNREGLRPLTRYNIKSNKESWTALEISWEFFDLYAIFYVKGKRIWKQKISKDLYRSLKYKFKRFQDAKQNYYDLCETIDKNRMYKEFWKKYYNE